MPMPVSNQEAKRLTTAAEFELVRASRSREARKPAEVRRQLQRARRLRDKYRDLAHRQQREARGKLRPPRRRAGSSRDDREATRRKQELFADAVERLQERLERAEGGAAADRPTSRLRTSGRTATAKASGSKGRTRAKRTGRKAKAGANATRGTAAEKGASEGQARARKGARKKASRKKASRKKTSRKKTSRKKTSGEQSGKNASGKKTSRSRADSSKAGARKKATSAQARAQRGEQMGTPKSGKRTKARRQIGGRATPGGVGATRSDGGQRRGRIAGSVAARATEPDTQLRVSKDGTPSYEEAAQRLDDRRARRQQTSRATRGIRKTRRLQSANLPRILGSVSVRDRINQSKRDKRRARPE